MGPVVRAGEEQQQVRRIPFEWLKRLIERRPKRV
jgi:hypothetical protein